MGERFDQEGRAMSQALLRGKRRLAALLLAASLAVVGSAQLAGPTSAGAVYNLKPYKGAVVVSQFPRSTAPFGSEEWEQWEFERATMESAVEIFDEWYGEEFEP